MKINICDWFSGIINESNIVTKRFHAEWTIDNDIHALYARQYATWNWFDIVPETRLADDGLFFTCDVESESVARGSLTEGDLEPFCRGEWFEEVAHHVHLGVFVELGLSPEDRIVEEVERVLVEVAFEGDPVAQTQRLRLIMR